MTRICGDASDFAASALHGYCLAHHDIVRPVRGGVVRRTPSDNGRVALVVGGGSGHYPAFVGYVGKGFAEASVAGDIFASPSTQAIINVARAANRGGGVILGYGNYAGDVLNFGIAAERLRDEGIDVRVLATTDDVASADDSNRAMRRGIAGDLTIFKIAGAAAEAGLPIDDVDRIGRHANDWTRTFGVAFGGCTIPGEKDKLFTVPKGRMALGLGLHGEPGIDEQDIPDVQHLAKLLFERVMNEAPAGAPAKVAVLLNGLGSTKYEELFVLWEALGALFVDAGLTVVAPLVGEYATSLEMAGCSLTFTWLDDELEQFWRAEVHTPALNRARVDGEALLILPAEESLVFSFEKASSVDGEAGGRCVAGALLKLSQALAKAEAELGRIDAQAGDGDHGQGMARGSAAAERMAQQAAKVGAGAMSVLGAAADAWADRAGGTSGALWGEGLRAFSTALNDDAKPTAEQLVRGARLAMDRIMALGGAKPGDKTLIDALAPFVEAFDHGVKSGRPVVDAWRVGAEASQKAADGTRDLTPRLGRARNHAQRSIGLPDAGALSLALAARVVGEFLSNKTDY